jgi:hypothetical protein
MEVLLDMVGYFSQQSTGSVERGRRRPHRQEVSYEAADQIGDDLHLLPDVVVADVL